MGIEEAADDRRHVTPPELDRRGDAQQPLHRHSGRDGGGCIVLSNQRPRLVVEEATRLSHRQPARRAIDQPLADALLERGERAGDGGRRAAQPGRRPRQAAFVHDAHEDRELVQPIHRIIP